MADRSTRACGAAGEDLAIGHLRKIGYKIIERNYRNLFGEVDIIAKHKGQIVFAEVKTRNSDGYGHPRTAITASKQRKISKVALSYLKEHHSLRTRSRFDVVTIRNTAGGTVIDVIPNAFELAYG